MKLIIDISEENYKWVCDHMNMGYDLFEMIAHGTPLPKTKTNGEIIEALFSNETIGECGNYYMGGCEFTKSWWNAPYKADKGESE